MTLKLSSKLSGLFDDDDEVEEVPIPKVPVKETRRLEIEPVDEEPFTKFRRVARAVKLLIQVCHVCKGLLEDSVSQEAWFALVDNLAAATALSQDKKKGRAFVTFLPNENRELSFDVTEFMRHKKAEDYLTDEIRNIMKQRPGTRTEEQITEVVRCLKGLCKPFNEYPFSVQKEIVQKSFYDKYRKNRVILRRGLPPDGVYFVLSGQLVEKPEGKKQPTDIEAGEKFGEEDLVCGSSRRATVLTKHEVEILFLHRFDYRVIFNMSVDSYDPKNLQVCKNDVVFQHFPMQKLVDNPGTWSTLKYKYGRLIVKDSNDIEWIYVIKSGEARVLKHLEPGRVDVKSRRKKIQQMMEEQSPYHKKKKILDFIADGVAKRSTYSPSNYNPGLRRSMSVTAYSTTHRSALRSRPNSPQEHRRLSTCRPNIRRDRPMTVAPRHVNIHEDKENESPSARARLPAIKSASTRSSTSYKDRPKSTQPDITLDIEKHSERDDKEETQDDVLEEDIKGLDAIDDEVQELPLSSRSQTGRKDRLDLTIRPKTVPPDISARYYKTPTPRSGARRMSVKPEPENSIMLPPFVQIETLHPGQTFGLRSCLEMDERGPSVSLVSGECEVLAINKKFFMKHCDDALYSLIRLKAKPFPSQTELVDRLDANMQWEEFKQETLKDFLRHRVRVSR